jgi:hypothetical protein
MHTALKYSFFALLVLCATSCTTSQDSAHFHFGPGPMAEDGLEEDSLSMRQPHAVESNDLVI